MRRISAITLFAVAMIGIAGCSTYDTNQQKALAKVVGKSEKELKELSKEEKNEIARVIFGESVYLLDPETMGDLIGDPAVLLAQMRAIAPNGFNMLLYEADAGYLIEPKGWMPPDSATLNAEQAKIEAYLDTIPRIYEPVTRDRVQALEKRFGEWWPYLSAAQKQKLIWDDAAFRQALTDDDYARGEIAWAYDYRRNIAKLYRSSDDHVRRSSRMSTLFERNGGQFTLPAGGSARTGS